MKIEATIDKGDLKRWNDSVDKLFADIRYYVSSPATYDTGLAKVRRGMHENKLALKNSEGWEKVKAKLRADGKIPYSDPLNVTGQLVDDFVAQTFATNPKDLVNIGVKLTFMDIPRARPTLKSMYAVYKDENQRLEYEYTSSYAVASKLEKYTGTLNGVNYNISDAIYKLYSQDFEKIVYAAVARAFNANK